jgi:hypothetical protein
VRRGARSWLVVLMLLAAAPALAQTAGGDAGGLHARGGSRSGGTRAPAADTPPPLKIVPEPWPRLDPGAILCTSEDALKDYQAGLETRSGDARPPLPAGCTRLLERTEIKIVQRDGPGRSQVTSSSPPGRSGWTDAWLPDHPP